MAAWEIRSSISCAGEAALPAYFGDDAQAAKIIPRSRQAIANPHAIFYRCAMAAHTTDIWRSSQEIGDGDAISKASWLFASCQRRLRISSAMPVPASLDHRRHGVRDFL